MDNVEIGKRIKLMRKKQNKTQVEAAKEAKISRSYYADVENGRYSASSDTLIKIANALKTSPQYILTGEKTIDDLTNKEKLELSKQLQKAAVSYDKKRDKYIQSVIDNFNFSEMSDEEIILLGRLMAFTNKTSTKSVNSLEYLIRLINMAVDEGKIHSDSFKKLYKQAAEKMFYNLLD